MKNLLLTLLTLLLTVTLTLAHGWTPTAHSLPPSTPLSILVSPPLSPSLTTSLSELATSISTPSSPLYSTLLTRDEVDARFTPHAPLAALSSALSSALAPSSTPFSVKIVPSTPWIEIKLFAGDAHLLLAESSCDLTVFSSSPRSGSFPSRNEKGEGEGERMANVHTVRCAQAEHPEFFRTNSPFLPHLAPLIGAYSGLSRLPPMPKPQVQAKSAGVGGPALIVDPSVIRKVYKIGDVRGGKSSKNSQAVAQFLGQHMDRGDLDEFFLLFADYAIGTHVDIIGPNHPPAGTEASLDIQYITAIGAKVNTTFWSTGGYHANQEPFLEWLVAVSANPDPPILFSVSYGDVEASLDPAYVAAVDAEFAKLATRKITVLFASGDSGVGCNAKGNAFAPTFPASSPWVTAVGGTTIGISEHDEETVNGLSTGGFSNIFPRPDYQAAAVDAYLKSNSATLPPSKYFNATSRGFPDIGALSSRFTVVVDLIPEPGLVAGTSCASPTAGGLFSLVNDARLAAGKLQLGHLNPLLYQLKTSCPACFQGVTKGGNPDQAGGCDGQCFFADPKGGWSPTVGLGAPRFDALVTEALKLP